MVDTLADTLARIKNAVEREKDTVVIRKSKLNSGVLEILKTEGFITDYSEADDQIEVALKYREDGQPMAVSYKRISSPGQRIYTTSEKITPVLNGRGISIISTSQGLMTGAMAKSKGIGGEYLCEIW